LHTQASKLVFFLFESTVMSVSLMTVSTHIATHDDAPARAPLLTLGAYSIYPMEVCTEDQVAELFTKICQRGNPLLQGLPHADLLLLGRAMYRKTVMWRLGQVVLHEGKPVAISCNWDLSAGGVWANTGLTQPASLQTHGVIGKAVMDTLPATEGKVFYSAFYGVLPSHPGVLFGYIGMAGYMLQHARGYHSSFQFTLLPTFLKRGLFAATGTAGDVKSWGLNFTDIPSTDAAVRAHLDEMAGHCNIALSKLDYLTGPKYMPLGAKVVRLKTPEELEVPCRECTTNHLEWISQPRISSRL